MIRELAVVMLSLVPVVLGSVFAYVFWQLSPAFDPLWRASFTVLTWVVGFAIGTRVFWRVTVSIGASGGNL